MCVRIVVVWMVAGCSFEGRGALTDATDAIDATDATTVAEDCFGTSGLATVCVATPPAGAQTISGDFDTDSDPRCTALKPTSSAVCAVVGASVVVSGLTTVIGSKPLVLVALDDIEIQQSLDVSSHRGGTTGPAADSMMCDPGVLPTIHGGGEGGSFGSTGGDGGHSNGQTSDQGLHGATTVAMQLRGGCAGAAGGAAPPVGEVTPMSEGHGGGAVMLIAQSIVVRATGMINASGSGGGGGVGGIKGGGGGGGSGGMIVLDAPQIAIMGPVFAKGAGGGGGAGGGDGLPGFDPGPTGAAAGGLKGSSGGDGGDGALDAASGEPGGEGTNSVDGGGGGGGGAGVIKVFQFDGPLGSTVSPPAT